MEWNHDAISRRQTQTAGSVLLGTYVMAIMPLSTVRTMLQTNRGGEESKGAIPNTEKSAVFLVLLYAMMALPGASTSMPLSSLDIHSKCHLPAVTPAG